MLRFVLALILVFSPHIIFAANCGFGSCFKLTNQSQESMNIQCYGSHWGYYSIEAAAQSQNISAFDITLNDGLGVPDAGKLQCLIDLNEIKQAPIYFINPIYGPVIDFLLLPDKTLKIKVMNSYGKTQAEYEFPLN